MLRLLPIVPLLVLGTVRAEVPRFQFTKGETLSYRLTQTTKITDTVVDDKTGKPVATVSSTKLDVVRNWKVIDVDDKGVATVEFNISTMRWERTVNNETDVFDSSKPDELNKGEMAKHVGPVLAIARIDARGQVVEVKESKAGSAARLQSDLPFKCTLPGTAIKVGDRWDRTLSIQLDPPFGTGEKHEATQTFSLLEPRSGLATIGITVALKSPPAITAEQIPLLPHLGEGMIFFNEAKGQYHAARLKVEKELKNHQGEGSSYSFSSTYVEDLITK